MLYRRWPAKADLVRAALLRRFDRVAPEPPDTGDLRGDLIAVMREMNEERIGTTALFSYYLRGYFKETGTNPHDLRLEMFGDRVTAVDVALDRANARGEVAADRLTPRRRMLAMDLLRHEALMSLSAVPDKVIVDDVVLPLVS